MAHRFRKKWDLRPPKRARESANQRLGAWRQFRVWTRAAMVDARFAWRTMKRLAELMLVLLREQTVWARLILLWEKGREVLVRPASLRAKLYTARIRWASRRTKVRVVRLRSTPLPAKLDVARLRSALLLTRLDPETLRPRILARAAQIRLPHSVLNWGTYARSTRGRAFRVAYSDS